MKQIKLTKGKYALVDDSDFKELSKYKWYFDGRYAMTSVKEFNEWKMVHMHRFLLSAPKDMETDHINCNMLDNRKENLRVCTGSQNQMNREVNRNNTSGYKGVSFNKRRRVWYAYIKLNYKLTYLGQFTDKKKAAFAYNYAALKFVGEFAKLNEV